MTTAPATRRERLRAATCTEIKTIARQHMAAEGAAALSLRAIAKEMGLTSAALYYYFKDRDALITALIVDAYQSLSDALRQARDTASFTDPATQLLRVTLAYRTWALAYPADYALIFGNPIPGYHAPSEETLPVARWSLLVFIELMVQLFERGELRIPSAYSQTPATLEQQIVDWVRQEGYSLPTPVVLTALRYWSIGHGLVSLELFNHLQPILGDPSAFFHYEVMGMLRQMGLKLEIEVVTNS